LRQTRSRGIIAALLSEVIAMAKCEICGKGPQFGHNISHSKRATNRMFKPNIQKHTLYIKGESRRMYVCASCLKTLNKAK
jgi:large subunit ribosomal protein L28